MSECKIRDLSQDIVVDHSAKPVHIGPTPSTEPVEPPRDVAPAPAVTTETDTTTRRPRMRAELGNRVTMREPAPPELVPSHGDVEQLAREVAGDDIAEIGEAPKPKKKK